MFFASSAGRLFALNETGLVWQARRNAEGVEGQAEERGGKAGTYALGILLCGRPPNTTEFASKLIALLAAVLFSGLGDEWVMEDIDSLPPYGTPLKTDRAEYEELRLKK
jgi:hypothetical protein